MLTANIYTRYNNYYNTVLPVYLFNINGKWLIGFQNQLYDVYYLIRWLFITFYLFKAPTQQQLKRTFSQLACRSPAVRCVAVSVPGEHRVCRHGLAWLGLAGLGRLTSSPLRPSPPPGSPGGSDKTWFPDQAQIDSWVPEEEWWAWDCDSKEDPLELEGP